jgi:hypothetical protein
MGKKNPFRILELKRTVELGHTFGPDNMAVHRFVVRIYKDLNAARTYVPKVFRRNFFRVKPSFVNTVADEVIEVEDESYAPDRFARPTEAQALKAVTDKIRSDYGPTFQRETSRARKGKS